VRTLRCLILAALVITFAIFGEFVIAAIFLAAEFITLAIDEIPKPPK